MPLQQIRNYIPHTWTKIKRILTDERFMMALWLLIGILSAVTKLSPAKHNNFLIFRGVFWHTWQQLPLYIPYPAEYGDLNHYGPLFSLVIAPFALLPDWAGLILWNVALTAFLYWAIRRMKLSQYQYSFMLWFCAHELLTALFMQQFNVAIAAIILLSYAFVRDEKDLWATCFLMLGTFVKLYGIVGLAFFFFSKHKGKYIASCLLWAVVFFLAPMLISSPEYIVSQYTAWADSLISKGIGNQICLMQNISLLGIIRKVGYACSIGLPAYLDCVRSGAAPIANFWSTYSDLWVIIPGMLLFFAPYLRLNQWQNESFRQTLVASVLMFVCLFSTGTESSGFIIALIGVVLWFTSAPWKRTGWDIALIIFAFILTSLSPSDLFPAYIRREWVQPFALKALPIAIIWIQLIIEMLTHDYANRVRC